MMLRTHGSALYRQPLSGSGPAGMRKLLALPGARTAVRATVIQSPSRQSTRRRKSTQPPNLADEMALLAPPRPPPEDETPLATPLKLDEDQVLKPEKTVTGSATSPAATRTRVPRPTPDEVQKLVTRLLPAVATAQVSLAWSSSLRAQLLAAEAVAPTMSASSRATSASEGPKDAPHHLRAFSPAGSNAAASTPQGNGWKLHGISARLPLAASQQDGKAAGGAALGSRVVYKSAFSNAVHGMVGRRRRWLRPGDIVRITHDQQTPGGGSSPAAHTSPSCCQRTYMVQALYRDQLHGAKSGGEPMVQLRVLLPGRDTVLEDAAAEYELFLLDMSEEGADADSLPGAVAGERGEGSSSRSSTGTSGWFESRSGSTDRSSPEARRLARLRPEETLVTKLLSDLDAAEVLKARDLSGRPCDHTHRLANAQADLQLQRSNSRAVAAGLPPTYVYRHVYCPRQGLFRPLRREQLRLGKWMDPQQLGTAAAAAATAGRGGGGQAPPCLPSKDAAAAAAPLADGSGFTLAGTMYKAGDFMYVDARAAGGQEGEPWVVVQLTAATTTTQQEQAAEETPIVAGGGTGSKAGKKAPHLQLAVRRFVRPEDLGADEAYAADWWDLFAPPPPPPPPLTTTRSSSDGTAAALATTSSSTSATRTSLLRVPVSAVAGKCSVVVAGAQGLVTAGPALPGVRALDTFRVVGSALPPHDPQDVEEGHVCGGGWLGELWASAAAATACSAAAGAASPSAASCSRGDPYPQQQQQQVRPLATLDIFAGCGGLSEGLHQSGVSSTLWAVEYEANAAEAYKQNNPQTAVLVGDCNALLQVAMTRAGQAKDCVVTKVPAADEAAAVAEPAPSKSKRSSSAAKPASALPPAEPQQPPQDEPQLPQPGEVELLVGGPPCQGFSGLNRHPGSDKAVRNNSLVGSYLSYCDFYRPRYFILENVMGFAVAQPVQPTEGGNKSRQRRARTGSSRSSNRSGSSTPTRGSSRGSGADDGTDWLSAAEAENESECGDLAQSETPSSASPFSFGGEVSTWPSSSPSPSASITAAAGRTCRVNYFKLAVRTLLDMGYQVRFGALNAGNHGVPQSRKRVFIIAALPEEALPNWPRPLHAFRVAAAAGQNREGQQDQPLIQLPGGCYFANGAGQRLAGTPLRAVTVRDAIGNLPPITPGSTGSSAVPLPAPMSAFQRRLAAADAGAEAGAADSGAQQLTHHVLVQPLGERHRDIASFVPPGMDFSAVLSDTAAAAAALTAAAAGDAQSAAAEGGSGGSPDSVLQHQQPQPQQYEAQLGALKERYPQLESRSNRSGFYGRLAQSGYFRTAITNPRVESSSGWSLHPDTRQQRSVSVREVARSQGFPDHHVFGGRTEDCYRQVGNAVPPPLALALGLQLRQALQARNRQQAVQGQAKKAHRFHEDAGKVL